MKATGAEIKMFWEHGFPEGCFHDDTQIEIDDPDTGEVVLDMGQKYDLSLLGYIYDSEAFTKPTMSFQTAFLKWRKARTTAVLVVEVAKEKEADLRAAIEAAGGKVK
jgi:hypothetical protein